MRTRVSVARTAISVIPATRDYFHMRVHASLVVSAMRLCVLGLAASCGSSGDVASEAQPNGAVGVTIVDSVRLNESDTAFIARPAGLAIAANGDAFVADNANKRVYHFTQGGAFVKSISQRGNGPGEVSSFGVIALASDSILVINNLARLRVEVFDARSGKHLWGRALPAFSHQVSTDNGFLYASAPDPQSRSSILSFASQTDSIKRAGILPSILSQNPILVGPFGAMAHDVRNGRIVESFEASDYVYSSMLNGPADSILLPKLRRRGAAVKELQATAKDTAQGRTALFKSSVPMLASTMSGSIVAVVHADVELVGNLFKGKYFLSLVNFKTRQVCIDLPLPVPVDPLPRLAMKSDTLIAVVQHADADDAPSAYLVRMHVDVSACPWNHVGRRI